MTRMASLFSRRLYVHVSAVCFLSLALCLGAAAQISPAPSEEGPTLPSSDDARTPKQTPVTLIGNDDILKMTRAGLSETVLLQTVQLQPGHYDTSPDALIALNAAGVPQTVISAMQRSGTGLHTHILKGSAALSQPAISGPEAPEAPLLINPAAVVPGVDELGVYYKDASGAWQPMHSERVNYKSGGAVKSIFTHDIVKKDMNGHIDGASSPLHLKAGMTLLLYVPAGTAPEEYDFLQFREHIDNREFRIMTGGVFHSESGARRDEITFTATKIAPRTYTFVVPNDIVKGQYGVLPPGSANQRGLADSGKVYTFAVAE